MTRRSIGIGLLILLGVVIGSMLYTTEAPTLESSSIATFAGVSLTIEFATTTEARRRGLGGRASVPEGYGMLFVFPEEKRYGFWMKDTLVPLDIFWLDTKGHVVSMALDIATSTYPDVFYPSAPALYVLETRSGFGRAHSVATGTPLVLKKMPSVSE